ncbi:hypothetical protein B0A52_08347 [Exophiala mesophila]|uniref:Uncharacterized protein n=1 Tax=Exophiala mesophila TaxID=212818 RepID=A0A438MTU2_EXOME|nr:hypothetical protein B0A52_08347 [Exophiala mesophila]
MASQQHDPFVASQQVAEKVMRRVEIAKVARNLQDCLAFASFKAQHGWQDRTLSSIEPEFADKLKRKRPSHDDHRSDGTLDSDDDFVPTSSIATNRFSKPTNATFKVPEHPSFLSRKRIRSSSINLERSSLTTSWKQDHHLAQSSPMLSRTQSYQGGGNFRRDVLDLPHSSHDDSPMFDVTSDDDDADLPVPSFSHEPSSSILSSSPPRTPPPVRRMHNDRAKKAGADALIFLANSPSRSPAGHSSRPYLSREPPSTPPSQHSHLPSSVMNTPGLNLGLFNGALQTPGQNFNLADFCNVTPSPAQAHWGGRTPNLAKTPNRFARRSLNFDNMQPGNGSPTMSRKNPTSHGLALQLGDELIPRS